MNAITAPELSQLRTEFLLDVLKGFRKRQKSLPCKYLYDQRGSKLFDRICELDEYYPTRTELAIMQRHAHEMAQRIGSAALLVEYGSGSSTKSRLLLDELDAPVGYIPLDISRQHLLKTAAELRTRYPRLRIEPAVADFTRTYELPQMNVHPARIVVYFPGSTIGNFTDAEAISILNRIADNTGPEGGLLIGIDLQKPHAILEAAYNDSAGVTAEFNLNLLHRINRELDADFCVDQYRHLAFFNQDCHRIEIYLESLVEQTVVISGESFEISKGERIHTEYSHKYTVESFSDLAAAATFAPKCCWTDPARMFAVLYLEKHPESK